MGLKLHEGGRVEFDDSHQYRVDTSLEKNMTRKILPDVQYHFVFRRNRGRAEDEGDGNPLIYALKGMNNYRLDSACRSQFMERAKEIVLQNSDKMVADFIFPMPSSFDFCGEFTNLLSETLNIPVMDSSFVVKKTVAEILKEAEHASVQIGNKRVRHDYHQQLKIWSQLDPTSKVAMKFVKNPKVRQYFNHLGIGGNPPDISGKKILVADDLMASGNSMRCLIDLLRQQGAEIEAGVCFLSDL